MIGTHTHTQLFTAYAELCGAWSVNNASHLSFVHLQIPYSVHLADKCLHRQNMAITQHNGCVNVLYVSTETSCPVDLDRPNINLTITCCVSFQSCKLRLSITGKLSNQGTIVQLLLNEFQHGKITFVHTQNLFYLNTHLAMVSIQQMNKPVAIHIQFFHQKKKRQV